jgi:hypothetical protein
LGSMPALTPITIASQAIVSPVMARAALTHLQTCAMPGFSPA